MIIAGSRAPHRVWPGARWLALFLPLALCVGCAAETSGHEAMMRQIEASVELPAGASAIDDYARNYAALPDGTVIAIYVKPHEPVTLDAGCDEVGADFETLPCSEETVAELERQDAQWTKAIGAAGESRWLDDYRDLPGIFDGGCMQIEVRFDPRSNEIKSVACNGSV
jgi:hypothetical protein